MSLSNIVFTPGGQPNYMAAGLAAANLVPNLADQFQKGQMHSIQMQQADRKRQMDLLQYQEAKQKADLFAAIAPELQAYQLAELQKKMQLLNGMAVPTNYNPQLGGGVTRTTSGTGGQPAPTTPVDQATGLPAAQLPALGFSNGPTVSSDVFGQAVNLYPTSPNYVPGITTQDASDWSG